jgi:tripartite-type tricarboxylate transporter receptor subunit TctC
MAEAGYPEVEGSTWTALYAPAGTPPDVIQEVNRLVVKIVMLPDVKEKLAALGVEPVGSSPEQLAVFLRSEMEKWSKVIRAAGIKPQ